MTNFLRHCFVPLCLVLAFLGLGLRVYTLQCTEQKDFEERKNRQTRVTVSEEALRGQIMDRNGAIFAMSRTAPALWCDPKDVKDREREARLVAGLLEMPITEIQGKVFRSNRYSEICRDMGDTEAHLVRTALAKGELPGFHIDNRQSRSYPKGELFGVQIGLCNEACQGVFGIEKGANYYLSGINGISTSIRDNSKRRFFTVESLRNIFDPQDGQNIVLTIDECLQQICQDELAKAAEKYTPKRAGIIMLDPSTGDILAMASYPFFDPNDRRSYKEGIFNNLLLSDPFEPGSIMKTISGSLALDKGVVSLDTLVDCEGGKWRTSYGRILNDDHKLGIVSFKEVIKYSSNIGIAKVGELLGREQLYEGLLAFGFGRRCDLVVMGGESPGQLSNVKKWTAYSLNSIPMGQEIGVTALQMVSAIGTIANHGVRMRPRIVKSVKMPSGEISPEAREFNYFEPQVANQRVISEKAALDMTEAMVAVTDRDGTGRLVEIPGYKAAGKTGTAQKYDPNTKTYSKTDYTATFAGFVPAYAPRIACVVVVDTPKGKIYGGTVAAPIFRDACKSALEYLQVPPEEEEILPEDEENGNTEVGKNAA